MSGCPNASWQIALAEVAAPGPAPILLLVGANKGYAIAAFLALWHSEQPVNEQLWARELLRYAYRQPGQYLRQFGCGNCGDCLHTRAPSTQELSGVEKTRGRVHAFEALESNRRLLRHVSRALNLTSAALEVHDLAISNATEGEMQWLELNARPSPHKTCIFSRNTRTSRHLSFDHLHLHPLHKMPAGIDSHRALLSQRLCRRGGRPALPHRRRAARIVACSRAVASRPALRRQGSGH